MNFMATLTTRKSISDLEKGSDAKGARLSLATASTSAESNHGTKENSDDVNTHTPSTPVDMNAFQVSWDGPGDPENPQVRLVGRDRCNMAQFSVPA